MSACRVDGCETPAKPGQLMCRSHWFQVPKPIRDAIWSTWRAGDMRSYAVNVRAAQDAIAARAAAQVQP